jgi:hypothetical protein
VAAVALLVPVFAADDGNEPLRTIRVQDRVTLQVSPGNMMLTQAIVVSALRKETEPRGQPNFVHLLISPLWIKAPDSERPAFTIVKPYINLSHGKVRRFVLTRPDGETLNSPADQTPDTRWVLTLDLGHLVPERLTVNVIMQQPSGIEPGTELHYTASNDGQPLRSGAPESVLTELRVKADPALEPWEVRQNGKPLARVDSSSVRIDRDVPTAIRFGAGQ